MGFLWSAPVSAKELRQVHRCLGCNHTGRQAQGKRGQHHYKSNNDEISSNRKPVFWNTWPLRLLPTRESHIRRQEEWMHRRKLLWPQDSPEWSQAVQAFCYFFSSKVNLDMVNMLPCFIVPCGSHSAICGHPLPQISEESLPHCRWLQCWIK